jgi:hypothetical protein
MATYGSCVLENALTPQYDDVSKGLGEWIKSFMMLKE